MNKGTFLIIAPGNKVRTDEGWSKEIKDLSVTIPSIVLTCGDIAGVWKKKGNYIILKDHFVLYPLYSILTFVLSLRYDTVLLECSPQTIYFYILVKLIRKDKIIYRIKSYSWIDPDKDISKRTYQTIEHFRGIIVGTEKGYKTITKYLPSSKIIRITPGILMEEYPASPPPPISSCFKILFASAPLSHHGYPEIFETKGINVLLKSIKYLNENLNYNVKLYMLWRNAYISELNKEIKQMGLEDKVIVINEGVNMIDYYNKCHATIFPAKDVEHSPDFPSSIMESLSVGRPVVVSNVVGISEIIKETKSGVVCEPTEIDLTIAVQDLMKNYTCYAGNCTYTAQSNFSLKHNTKILMD